MKAKEDYMETIEKAKHALSLYLNGIGKGKISEVIEEDMGESYIQHSTGVKTGKDGFKDFFEDFIKRNPQRDIQVVRTIVDRNFVFLNVFQNLNNGEAQWITSDIFRIDSNYRVIEHWDVIDSYEQTENDLIFGDFEIVDVAKTEQNKMMIRTFMTEVLQNQKYTLIDTYCDENIIQHSKLIQNKIENYVRYLITHSVEYDFIFKVIGQGNYVAAYSKVYIDQTPFAVFDVFKIVDGKIIEHWDNKEQIPSVEDLMNCGKF